MNSTFRNTASIIALVVLLMVSLYTISDATSHSATFGKYYNWLLFFNAIGMIALQDDGSWQTEEVDMLDAVLITGGVLIGAHLLRMLGKKAFERWKERRK